METMLRVAAAIAESIEPTLEVHSRHAPPIHPFLSILSTI